MHVNEDIRNATVFFQHPKNKPLLPCKARDGISQRAWCLSFNIQKPFAAVATVKIRAKDLGPPCMPEAHLQLHQPLRWWHHMLHGQELPF